MLSAVCRFAKKLDSTALRFAPWLYGLESASILRARREIAYSRCEKSRVERQNWKYAVYILGTKPLRHIPNGLGHPTLREPLASCGMAATTKPERVLGKRICITNHCSLKGYDAN